MHLKMSSAKWRPYFPGRYCLFESRSWSLVDASEEQEQAWVAFSTAKYNSAAFYKMYANKVPQNDLHTYRNGLANIS